MLQGDAMQQVLQWLAGAIVLFTAMPIHECAHGFIADKLGDNTARMQGRLTLNPIKHLDLLGSLLLIFTGFGWAKPVQVDMRNFRNPKRDMALTALAGPVSNVLFALAAMIVYKLTLGLAYLPQTRNSTLLGIVLTVLSYMITVNLYLAVFNFLPVPPLDGSKIFGALLPERYYYTVLRYERYIGGILFLLIITGVLSPYLARIANFMITFLDMITFPIDLLFYRLA